MFDVSWTELTLIAVVALFVIGPKDLPMALKTVGAWVGRARSMAREFQSGIDEMIREAELDELRKKAQEVTSFDLERKVKETIDPTGAVEKAFDIAGDPAPRLEPPPPALPGEGGDYVPPAPEDVSGPPMPAQAVPDQQTAADGIKSGTGV